ncbi:glycerophosphodiester phosphodiesterase [Aestuariicella hydrocarbonica]|uniref:Glycerophosphodiester phosphodiesterase n=1 Tax=Pseudomaricurvus hydrocarbonicus TaxID=1470433 RepID=A0A9E5JPS0_9GAMM|nr:glycerophosphodiester phosphodiesterase [Aestuariicella hydrocarbonica]NHO64353.1 glycerophosphodiester phosphodiesterase [Aestuariicella hydrocarbonica]
MARSVPSSPLLCIAHRGGSQLFSENTLAAFTESLALGVDAIELDIWNIGGELLVTHDRRLGKTLPGQGRLIDHHPQQLKELILECGNRLTTLPEVLELVGNQVMLNIELKGPNCVDGVASALESYARDHQAGFDHYVISSFDHRQLYDFKQCLPQVKRGVLVEGVPLDYAACADALEAYSFHPSINFINQELVNDAKVRGLQVWVYTVNEEEDMQWMVELGVDGVFTDFPRRLLAFNHENTIQDR